VVLLKSESRPLASALSEDKEMGLKGWLLGPKGSDKKARGWEGEKETGPPELEKKRIAVLPFANMSPDPADGYLADGMTEELITELAGIGELSVIARTSVMKYRGSPRGASEIGKELKAGTLIEGSVRKAGNKVRVTVQLIDARNEDHIWAQNYDKPLNDIFAIQSEIAERVADELKIKLFEPVKLSHRKEPTKSTDAHLLYLKGRHYWNERTDEGMKEAIECFNLSIKTDPNFALGYSGLADCYYTMAHNYQADPKPAYLLAKQSALKALDSDYDLTEAHTTLAGVMFNCEHQWGPAEEEFKLAIKLSPSYASAHQWYHNLLLFQRRFDEAESEIRRALELDPFSVIINACYFLFLYCRGDFDEAISQYRRILEIEPSSRFSFFTLHNPMWSFPFVKEEMFEEALREIDRITSLPGKTNFAKLARGYVYAAMGRSDESRELLQEAAANYHLERLSQYAFARAYFLLGDNEIGLQWMQKGYEDLEGLLFFPADFELNSLKSDPAYFDTLKKMGLDRILSR